MSTVSVIVASWNARGFLRDCLESICRPLSSIIREVIVVDNASTDGSAEMVVKQFPEVNLIRAESNLGFARANNIGLRQASGKYLALINSDVIVHPGCLETLASFFETHSKVGLVGPKIFGANGRLQYTGARFPKLWNTTCRTLALDSIFPRLPFFAGFEMSYWDHGSQAEVEVLSGCFWLVRREAVNQVGYLDERFFFYAEDFDWCKRLQRAGWKVVFVPQATATHFGGSSSNSARLDFSIEMLKANLRFWKKYRGLWGQMIFYFLSILHHSLRLVLRKARTILGGASNPDPLCDAQRNLVCLRWLITGRGT